MANRTDGNMDRQTFLRKYVFKSEIKLGPMKTVPLLNKHYSNEGNLTG